MIKFCRHIFLICLSLIKGYIYASSPTILSIERIWDHSAHNAFTDLIYYHDRFFLCFREANSHAAGEDGKIRILVSSDGRQWNSAALIAVNGRDLRDPMLSVMPDGKLMLTMGGSIYRDGKYIMKNPCVAFTEDGYAWSPVNILDMPSEWIWRVTWHNGVGYGASYSLSDEQDINKPWNLKLFKTTDGLHYSLVTNLDVTSHPSEATLRFLDDGLMVALTRRDGHGWIGSSLAPYTKWNWTEIGYRLGGPNFLVLPDGEMWACSRRVDKECDDKYKLSVVLARMGLQDYQPILQFPSGGDCGYPGMVYREGKLYVSYYSSHEGKACIYFAVLLVQEFRR